MAGVITCTARPDIGAMLIEVDWSAATDPTAHVKIERIVNGEATLVRQAYAPLVSPDFDPNLAAEYMVTNCGQIIFYDFEAPTGVTVQYRASDDATPIETVTSAGCALADDERVWIKDICAPCNNIATASCTRPCPETGGILFIGHDSESYGAVSAQFDVVGRRRPITISNPRRDATTVVNLASLTCDDRDKIINLLASGRPILIPEIPEICWPTRWLAVGDHTVTPLSRDLRRQPRLHTIPAVVVDPPAGPAGPPCGIRWADMCDIAETWNAMDALSVTTEEVLLGTAP